MMMTIVLLAMVLGLAWANGANDVAKGVATLVGGGVASAQRAILWGGLTSVLGGLAALAWGGALVSLFSKGFLAGNPELSWGFSFGAIGGAAAWVLLATRFCLPVSTTHGLIGGVMGAALATWGPEAVHFAAVGNKALIPLLASPLAAIALCGVLLLATRLVDRHLPSWSPGCCDPGEYGKDPFVCAPETPHTRRVRRAWVGLHWLSSGLVSFARGLNDVPKIAALALPALIAVPFAQVSAVSLTAGALVLVTMAMGAGSVWGGFRLMPVLSCRVSQLDVRTGLAANLGTSMLVLAASPLGLPVSTTHVATGSLMGVRFGERSRPLAGDALKTILFGWVVTLPVAAAMAYVLASVVRLGLGELRTKDQ